DERIPCTEPNFAGRVALMADIKQGDAIKGATIAVATDADVHVMPATVLDGSGNRRRHGGGDSVPRPVLQIPDIMERIAIASEAYPAEVLAILDAKEDLEALVPSLEGHRLYSQIEVGPSGITE